jgi:hypothetical protein
MRPITVDKLNPFVYQGEAKGELYNSLKEIHTTDNFSIASDATRLAIIYNSTDHELKYTPFGDGMDTIISALQFERNRCYDPFRITTRRKLLLDAVQTQVKELKQIIKKEVKEEITRDSLAETTMTTKVIANFDDCKLHVYTYSYYKDKHHMDYTITDHPELNIDVEKPGYPNISEWKIAFNTQYLIDLLKFFVWYDTITLITNGSSVTGVRCEGDDREAMLLPKRVDW